MKTERFQARGRLLNDVLSEELESLGGRRKEIAVAAFRRARLGRRVRGYGGLALIIAAAAAVVFQYPRIERPGVVAVNTSELQPLPALVEKGDALLKLTDEELIASFPPNTCFLAEVDGRQVLVFTERALREKFLHKPTGPSSQGSF